MALYVKNDARATFAGRQQRVTIVSKAAASGCDAAGRRWPRLETLTERVPREFSTLWFASGSVTPYVPHHNLSGSIHD